MYRSGPASPHEQFLDQFEMDGGNWLYRYKEIGAAYRVTDAEKDTFVAGFDRRQKRFMWAALAIYGGLFLGLLLLYLPSTAPPFLGFWLYLLAATSRFIADQFAFRVPMRALEHRAPVAPGLSKAERRRRALDGVPAAGLFGAAAMSAIILLLLALSGMLTSRFGLWMTAGCAGVLLWTGVQSYRKWQVAQADLTFTSPTT